MSNNSFLFTKAPQWKAKFRGIELQVPANLLPWLNETGSLTKRLRSVYGQQLTLELLYHQWKPAYAEECQRLQVPQHRYHLIREVLLHVNEVPLVLARTVLPEHTIRIAHRNLSHLGTRPLGEVIFAYPDLELRQRDFSLAPVTAWSCTVRTRFALNEAIWGRRTLYAIHHHPILVSEFFLPAMLAT